MMHTVAPKRLAPVQATMETLMKSPQGAVRSTARFFRDDQGRTRIEHGDLAAVNDPVGGRSFLLNLPNKIAIPRAPAPPELAGIPGAPALAAPSGVRMPEMKETADLGERVVEGVRAYGKRYALPAPGKPEPPTAEIWTSRELQLPVHSSIADPSTGAITTTVMKNIVAGAKLDPALFDIPKDFKAQPPLKS
jgi:hypothetical protein